MLRLSRVSFSHGPVPQDPAWPGWKRLLEVFAALGEETGFDLVEQADPDTRAEGPEAYNFTYNRAPSGTYGLMVRPAYHGPFWQIDKTFTPWKLEVARRRFLPGSIEQSEAEVFYHYWRDRLFGDAPYRTRRDGFAFVPLQGPLMQRTAGQYCTPMEMLEQTLVHEPDRPIIASLSPHEPYGEDALARLRKLDERYDRMTIRVGDTKRLLRTCDYVVTQSAGTALDACFFGKTAVLFASVDAHHIGLDIRENTAEAFEAAFEHAPDYALYATWFLRENAINVTGEDAPNHLAQRLHNLDWPVDLSELYSAT